MFELLIWMVVAVIAGGALEIFLEKRMGPFEDDDGSR